MNTSADAVLKPGLIMPGAASDTGLSARAWSGGESSHAKAQILRGPIGPRALGGDARLGFRPETRVKGLGLSGYARLWFRPQPVSRV
jgi:hypothetical protein